MTAAGRELLRGRVVHARVWALAANAITYRGALAFERLITIAKYVIAIAMCDLPVA
jgi:hypothetical protein